MGFARKELSPNLGAKAMSVTFKKLAKEKLVPAFVIAVTLTVISGCSKRGDQTEAPVHYRLNRAYARHRAHRRLQPLRQPQGTPP